MKKFTIPCKFGSKKAPFDVYIGGPAEGEHPLKYQDIWLRSERGGVIPKEVMDSFEKLLALSKKNGVDFEKLSVYALEAANSEKEKKASAEKEKEDKKDREIENQCSILVRPNLLRQYYEDSFIMLLINGPGPQGSMLHTVNLMRLDLAEQFIKSYKAKSVNIDNVNEFGLTEFMGKGPELSLAACYQLFIKYLPEYQANAREVLKLLSAAGMPVVDMIKYIFPESTISEHYSRKTVPEVTKEDSREWELNVAYYHGKLNRDEGLTAMEYLSFGYAKLKLEEYSEAIEILTTCIALSGHAYAYNNRGLSRLRLGDRAGALKDIQKSIEIDGKNSYAYKNLGKYFMAIGENEQALVNLLTAKKMGYLKQYGKEVDELIDQIVVGAIIQ